MLPSLSTSKFTESVEQKSNWRVVINTPPSDLELPNKTVFSPPFQTLVAPAVTPAKPAKRPRIQPEVSPAAAPAEEEMVEDEPRNKKTPFQRSAALDGQLRTYKVLMRPTASHIKELKRCFSVARLGFSQANAQTKGGAPRNKIKLRNEMLAMPQPP